MNMSMVQHDSTGYTPRSSNCPQPVRTAQGDGTMYN